MSNSNIAAPGVPQTREAYEAEQAQRNRQVQIGTGGYASETYANDRIKTETRPRVETGYAADVDYTMVTVNGASMKREQYIALLASGGIPPGAKVDDPTARRHAAEAKADPSFTDGAPGNAEGNVEDEGNEDSEEKPHGDDAVFRSGQLALDAARAELGADTVEALVGEAVASGDLEAVKTALADGNVTAEQVGKVYAAYAASAQSIIADVGISVETMSEVLGEDDLRSAREAVVKGDVSRVQDIAGRAVETLATLPETNPQAFEEYVDRRFPDLAYKVEGGKTLVATSQGWLPFDSLVRSGLLQKATLVPNFVTWPDEE